MRPIDACACRKAKRSVFGRVQMLSFRNLILCVVVPVALVAVLQRHPGALSEALGWLPTEHVPRLR
jgi:hypothetical protein